MLSIDIIDHANKLIEIPAFKDQGKLDENFTMIKNEMERRLPAQEYFFTKAMIGEITIEAAKQRATIQIDRAQEQAALHHLEAIGIASISKPTNTSTPEILLAVHGADDIHKIQAAIAGHRQYLHFSRLPERSPSAPALKPSN